MTSLPRWELLAKGSGYISAPAVTVDLDSTLCDTGHRQGMIDRVNGTDWEAYSNACAGDGLVMATAALVWMLDTAGYPIHYVTGRTESAREATNRWLNKHRLPSAGLWMDDSDQSAGGWSAAYGSHAEYKVQRVLRVQQETGRQVILHIDDWAEVKAALEAEGIPCVCVRTPQEVAALVAQDRERELLK